MKQFLKDVGLAVAGFLYLILLFSLLAAVDGCLGVGQ